MAGRPTTVTPEAQKQVVAALKRGHFRDTACRLAGITYRSFARFVAKKDDAGALLFRQECEEAEAYVENGLLNVALTAALKGDLKTVRWFLAMKWPEKYGQQRELLREVRRVIAKLEKERANLRREVHRLRGTKAA